jgi:hypothetical protein
MSLEELENIMTDLENNCTNEKDDKINEESARNIIEKKYSKYLNYIDSIINHFKDRRMSIKKSLIRKKWHKNKSTDKFLTNTFKRRASDKRQTRKNNQNKGESLEKIKEAKKFCEDYLSLLMNDMSIKETSKKNLLKIEEFIFLSEINKFKKENIPDARIKENKSILKEIEKNNKKNEENIPKSTNNQKNISRNPNDSSIASSQNRIKNNINTNIAQISQNGNNNDNSQINNININDQRRIHPQSPENANINNTKKTNNNKNQTRNKNDIFPDVSLNCLLNNNSINLNEENYNENNNKKKNSVRMRIRINRNNQIVIDRYIQNNNDFDPFNDSYNEVFANYRKYDINELEYLTNNNFEKLYNSFNLNKLNELNIFCDSEDEDTNGDIKQFSNSYKQFLKSKRALEKES